MNLSPWKKGPSWSFNLSLFKGIFLVQVQQLLLPTLFISSVQVFLLIMILIMNTHLSSQTSTAPSVDENEECFHNSGAKRILLLYEDNLRELFQLCPKCGSPVNTEEIEERKNEGAQYSVNKKLLDRLSLYLAIKSQPSIPGVKGEGNLALSAGLFFIGIQFTKFHQFASAII